VVRGNLDGRLRGTLDRRGDAIRPERGRGGCALRLGRGIDSRSGRQAARQEYKQQKNQTYPFHLFPPHLDKNADTGYGELSISLEAILSHPHRMTTAAYYTKKWEI